MIVSPEMAVKIINVIIAPAVMITAAAILLGSLIQRYKILDDVLRDCDQPHAHSPELHFSSGQISAKLTPPDTHRLSRLLKHHHLLHQALVATYLAILAFVTDMLAIALAELTGYPWLTPIVLFIFLLGISLLCGSVIISCREVMMTHRIIQLETHHPCPFCFPQRGRTSAKQANI
jgi:hypothetical protein